MKSGLLALLLLLLSTGHARADNTPLVAVASSLRQVWPLLMAEFQHPQALRVTFGSSGNLARQITQGAPFELFLSADQSFPQWLVENGTTDHLPAQYTQGKLAWVALPETPLAQWLLGKNAHTDEKLIIPAQVKRLAIANPAFAPYGRAAREVLDRSVTAEALEFTLGENAVQALQFALSGATDGGIVPLALVSDTARKNLPAMVVLEIDVSKYSPLIHTMTIIGNPTDSTQALFDYLLSKSAQSVFAQNGFVAVK